LDLWAGVSIFEISVKTEKYENGMLLNVPTTSGKIKLVEDNYGKFVARVKGEDVGIFVTDDLTPFQTFWIKEDTLENLPEARMDITVRCRLTKEGLINLNGVVEKNEFLDRGGEDERAYKYNWDRIDTTFHEGEQKVLRLYDDGKGTVYFLRLQAKVIGEIKEVEKCLAITMEYRAKRLDTGQGLCRVNNGVCILPNNNKGESLNWSCGAKCNPEADQAKEISLDFEGSMSADFISTDEIKVRLKLKRNLAFPYEGNGGKTVLTSDAIVKEFALVQDQPVEIQLPKVPENFPFELDESLIFTYKGETNKK
jgi:hypothetical protein